MSHPRYDWWSYTKGMIRRYPELCVKEADLKSTNLSPLLGGMPGAKGSVSNPVADAALRDLPAANRRELEAVRKAISSTYALPDGRERIDMVRMVFWDRTHTLDGVAMQLHRCNRTVRQWHGDFIREVAKWFGLM